MSFENLQRNKCNMSTNRHATLDLMKRFEMIKFQKLISAQRYIEDLLYDGMELH